MAAGMIERLWAALETDQGIVRYNLTSSTVEALDTKVRMQTQPSHSLYELTSHIFRLMAFARYLVLAT